MRAVLTRYCQMPSVWLRRQRFVPFLGMAKNDRGCSQNRATNKEGEIGQKQWQQHQGEAAKHRCPVFHPFAVGEDDEAEGAENNASDAVQREEVRHIGHTRFL